MREAGIPFAIPEREDLPDRLDAVLEAIYAAYATGWDKLDRSLDGMVDEAIWLGQLVVSLLPDEPEPKGMVSLMLHTHARRAARRDAAGGYVPLADQDTELWDLADIGMAETLLRQANRTGPTGRYQIEAAIQSVHAMRRIDGSTDWHAISALYDHLLALTGSPVVALNRAAVLAEIEGPDVALEALAPLAADKRMAQYQPYWATRGHLLQRAARHEEAGEALTMAIGLSVDPAVRAWLARKRDNS
jgi:RNA polymerase sigma-70 factor (ECF subfamily)